MSTHPGSTTAYWTANPTKVLHLGSPRLIGPMWGPTQLAIGPPSAPTPAAIAGRPHIHDRVWNAPALKAIGRNTLTRPPFSARPLGRSGRRAW
jgi:hypothetical protein